MFYWWYSGIRDRWITLMTDCLTIAPLCLIHLISKKEVLSFMLKLRHSLYCFLFFFNVCTSGVDCMNTTCLCCDLLRNRSFLPLIELTIFTVLAYCLDHTDWFFPNQYLRKSHRKLWLMQMYKSPKFFLDTICQTGTRIWYFKVFEQDLCMLVERGRLCVYIELRFLSCAAWRHPHEDIW